MNAMSRKRRGARELDDILHRCMEEHHVHTETDLLLLRLIMIRDTSFETGYGSGDFETGGQEVRQCGLNL